MTDLSPAAQAVLDATGRKTWYRNNDIAAALRALAKQAGYDNYHVDGDHGLAVVNVRDILAIATELENND
jgi:hypothetical protein